MFDRRVINCNYSLPPMQMVMGLVSLMDREDWGPALPVVCPDGITVFQNYCECPGTGGCGNYYRVSQDGTNVLLYDPENSLHPSDFNSICSDFPDEFATLVIPLNESFAARLLQYLETGE